MTKQMCYKTGKICLSQKAAGTIKNQYTHHQNGHKRGSKNIVQRSYRCPYCSTWHLTHIKNWVYSEYLYKRQNRLPEIKNEAKENLYA